MLSWLPYVLLFRNICIKEVSVLPTPSIDASSSPSSVSILMEASAMPRNLQYCAARNQFAYNDKYSCTN